MSGNCHGISHCLESGHPACIHYMVPTVRGGQGKLGSFKKSGKVMESQVKWRGSGNFITVARKKSIIVFSIYILALKCDL